jgi:pyruvate/2-oxoglutarate dehydrogenase complex dihydrolipoamide acyltransferase (E2) component
MKEAGPKVIHSQNHTKDRIRLTRIQKLIGERMLHSKLTKPCFYLESRADVTELMSLRPGLRKSLGVKITTNAFYIRGLALAGKKFPIMLGVIDGDNIKIADAINVGFAVNAPQGLVVPVIKNAERKKPADIAREEKLLTEKARDNKLTLEEMEGETIALSNLGAYAVDSFVGIVPPPVSSILSVGNINRVAVPQAGRPVEKKIVTLTLAADRRVISEDYAARFLRFIADELQNPQELL